MQSTPIQEFYSNSTIFITGGTGFLGKVVIEKLLRSCHDLKKIYVLIRSKKGQSREKRLQEFFNTTLYDRLKIEQPKSVDKLCMIQGDCELPDLGLSLSDQETLKSEVNCVFHVAATVRFDEDLKKAIFINVRATRDLLQLAKQMTRLKSFLHISTAYSFCVTNVIEERYYEAPINHNDLIAFAENDKIEDKPLFKQWPNTYTLTKAVGENVIEIEGAGMPIAIIRPSIVTSSANEPVSGWIDNMYGPTAIILGVLMGIVRTFISRNNCVADVVPVDYVANNIIAVGLNVGSRRFKENPTNPIYNCVSSPENPLTWQLAQQLSQKYFEMMPSMKVLWYTFYCTTTSPFIFNILHYLLHVLPAYVFDFILVLTGQKPFLNNIYKKVKKNINLVAFFANQEWTFRNGNNQKLWRSLSVEDKSLFRFNMDSFTWNEMAYSYVYGIRMYLLKEKFETVPEAKKRFYRLKIAHYTLLAVLMYYVYKLLFFIINAVIERIQ